MSLRRVDRAVADYTALRPRLLPATDEFVALVTGTIDDAGINYLSVTGRTKAIGSFAAKARGVLADDSTADPLRAVTDQVGVRVITYVQRDIDAVAGLLAEQFTVLDDRDLGEETARGRTLRLRQPAPAGVASAGRAHGIRPVVLRLDPAAHGAAARVGGVRARHPLQGHGAARAGARPRPAVHPGGRAARAGRQGVRGDPRPAAGGAGRQRRRRRRRARPADQRAGARDLPGRALLRTPAGRAPSTTSGSPGCCSSSASPRSTSWARRCATSTARRSPRRWTTATRPARCAGSTTTCSRRSATPTSPCTATRTAASRWKAAAPTCPGVERGWDGRRRHAGSVTALRLLDLGRGAR